MELSTSVIKSLKESYDTIPNLEGNVAAKVMVADSIKSNGLNPEDVLSFICKTIQISSTLLDEAAWKKLIDQAIKRDDFVGHNMDMCKPMKGTLSNEEYFSMVAKMSGKNPDYLKSELVLDKYGWKDIVETLIKTSATAEENKVEETVKVPEEVKTDKKATKSRKKTKKENKPSIKSSKRDPRCMSVVGIHKETGERKVWGSMKEAELDLGAKHGTVSQAVSGKLKAVKGWTISKAGVDSQENTPVKKNRIGRSRGKTVRMYGTDKDGKMVDRRFSSVTDAAKKTGICHSSISKSCHNVRGYETAGGYHWELVEKKAVTER